MGFFIPLFWCHVGCEDITLQQIISHAILGRSKRLFIPLKFVSFKSFTTRYFLLRCFQGDCLNALFAKNLGGFATNSANLLVTMCLKNSVKND